MARRNPARFLAPVALVAFAVALYMVISHGLQATGGSGSSTTKEHTPTPAKSKSGSHRRRRRVPKTYTVKSGDTASGIAAKAGVSLSTLRRLNPRLDPQNLSPGQKLRLRR
jgi:LysM repeat protein